VRQAFLGGSKSVEEPDINNGNKDVLSEVNKHVVAQELPREILEDQPDNKADKYPGASYLV